MPDILEKVINADDSETSDLNETINTEIIDGEEIAPIKEELTKIYSGDAISDLKINEILAKDLVRFIVLAGLPSYGKTTLLATIFEHFLYFGQFCGYDFAGSDSLIGFDKRCYLSRLSNTNNPDTKHTVLGEDYYLDLSIVNQKNKKRERLIIVDTSGETFQKFQLDNDAVKEFIPLLRADHFVYIIDASLLKDKISKQDARDAALTIIRSIKECEMYPPNIKIEIVFSKWDMVNEDKKVIEFKDLILKEIKTICTGYDIKDFVINSRNLNNSLELKDLFLHWLNDDIIYEYQNKITNNITNWKDDHLKYIEHGRENK
jgi:hypothetical protein